MAYRWGSSIGQLLALAAMVGLLAGCGATAAAVPASTPEAAITAAATEAVATTAATEAPAQAADTPVPAPSPEVAPTATAVPPAPTASQGAPTAPAGRMTVQVFLIAVGDNGQSGKLTGCGDSAVPVRVTTPATEGVLRAALSELLAVEGQYYGESGLYNALYQSELRVEDVAIEAGTAVIELSGRLMLGGECDGPRVVAQIEETARQFSTVQAVTVFVNGEPLKAVLSLQG